MKVWEDKRIPHDWNEATIIRIPKKGALNDCNNWRGVTLLSIPSKIIAKIIINRLSSVVDSRLSEEQAGFRKGKGCIDQIFALLKHHRTVHRMAANTLYQLCGF